MTQLVEKFGYGVYNYDWSEFRVFKHPDNPRKYAVDISSGCSCDSYEPPLAEDLRSNDPLTKVQVRNKFSDWWDRSKSLGHYGTKVSQIELLNSSL